MARYHDEEYYEDYRPRYTRTSNMPAWTMAIAMIGAAIAFGVWLYPDLVSMPGVPEKASIGNQAPPSAVRRTTSAPGAAQRPAQSSAPDVQTSIDQYNAVEQAKYDAAVAPAAAPVAQPLPLNSAGEPVIDAAQQAQMNQSLILAEQEGAAAADAQLAAQREAANAEALSRPPDVSKEDAEQMMHRDLCSVPRANPHTCSQGLYKPTPVN